MCSESAYDPAEADLELLCNSWSAGFLGERLQEPFTIIAVRVFENPNDTSFDAPPVRWDAESGPSGRSPTRYPIIH